MLKKNAILKRIAANVTYDALMIIYNTTVLPHFTCATTVVYLASKRNLEKLEVL